MPKTASFCVVLCAWWFSGVAGAGPCQPDTGLTYYVSPAGTDTHTGQTPATAFRQIRQALTVVQPGDTVLIADGIYLGFTASDLAGTTNAPITLRALGTNAYVNATTDRADNRDNILITFCAHLVLDGLNSTNAPRAGLRIDQSPNITVRRGRFGNNATWGIFTDFSDDLLLEGNECFGSVTQHGIYTSNSGDRPVLRHNHCHDNAAVGIHMNGDASQGGDGLISGALVEGNLIHDNGTLGGAGINMDGVQDSIIRNNVLYQNHATGIALFQIDGAAGPKGNLIANNTVDVAANGRWAILLNAAAGPNTIRNNILFNRHPFHGAISFATPADAALTDSDFNILGGNCVITTNDAASTIPLANWQAAGHELHSLCAPITNLVVNALSDYHLRTNAPAIDAGQTLATVRYDFDYVGRPAGTSTDVGAYEFGGTILAPGVAASIVASNACLRFPSFIGLTYDVDWRDDLTAGNWASLTNSLAGTGDPITLADPAGALHPKRFYRVHATVAP